MPGFPVLHCFPEFVFKLMSIESVMPSNHLITLSETFILSADLLSKLYISGSQSIGALVSASVFLMSIQG